MNAITKQELKDSWLGLIDLDFAPPTMDDAIDDIMEELRTMEARTPKRVHVNEDGDTVYGSKGHALLVEDQGDGVIRYECYKKLSGRPVMLAYDMEDVDSLGAWVIAERINQIINGEE